jgi:nitrite reductase (cytochrome c-552)
MEPRAPEKKRWPALVGIAVVAALVAAGITALLVNIIQRKTEAKQQYVRLVEVTEDTVDPKVWGTNWPREYDSYLKTVDPSRTNFGGGDASPAQKADQFPWLTRIFAGYAFSLDYRDRRGHAYMLLDQEKTRRVTERPQPGACLHCHASIIPAYRFVGKGDVMKGFEEVCAMTYQQAHALKDASGKPLVDHPVSCVDCHDAKTLNLRVTRPGFIVGIKALKEHQGVKDYDPNRDASRQEMRSYVCGQCHVEYYFRGDRKTVTYPWKNGLKVDEIEAYYDDGANFADGKPFKDWIHAEAGTQVLKAQHPEFELWNQGVHSRSGVACADCHMPYVREGAVKVSDHWVRSPLLNVSRACQTCHPYAESEIQARVAQIQTRNHDLLQRAGGAIQDMLDTLKAAKAAGATDAQLGPARALHRKAQWRLDFVAAENSMGFHAPQEAARILGEAIDYGRQAQLSVERLRLEAATAAKPAPGKGAAK